MSERRTAAVMLSKSALPHDLGSTLDHARRVMGAPLAPGIEAELRRIAKAVHRQLRRYGFAGQNGQSERARKLEYLLSTAFGCRVIAILHAYPKGGPHICWEKVKQLANGVCPRLPSKDVVTVEAHSKSGGGYRSITKFKVVARANQSLARDLLVVRLGHSRHEYARKGRGRERLIEKVINANRNGGVRALGTFDVKDCFTSMKREAAYSTLPISKAIINNTIYISDHATVAMKTKLISEHAVRTGLPQGALSSVIVAGLILKPCLDALGARFLGSHIDDIVVGDTDEAKVKALLDTLAAKLKVQHPSSPLFEKCRQVFKIGRPADVLGYWPRPNPPEFGGGIRLSPSNKAIRRSYVRIFRRLLLLPASQWHDVLEEKAYAFATSCKHWGGSMGGREIFQLIFQEKIFPLVELTQKQMMTIQTIGTSPHQAKKWAKHRAEKLVPEQVLVKAGDLDGHCYSY